MNRRQPLPGQRPLARTLVLAAGWTVVALGGTFALDPFRNYQLALVAAYLCATAGLTVLVGATGQLSLGHAALMAVGGYGYALTSNAVPLTGPARFVVALLAAALASAVVGLLLGLAAARLSGPYLAGLTLAVVVALPAAASTWSTVLRGDQGVQTAFEGVPDALRGVVALEQWQAMVAVVVAAVVVTGLAVLRSGRFGLRMQAVRDDEVAARLSGIPAGRVKVLAFTASSVAAGLGGAVLCHTSQAVTPGAYTVGFSLLLVVAVVIGGLGSILGAALGSAVVVLLPWLIGRLTTGLPTDAAQRLDGNLAVLVFGLLLITVMALAPEGLHGALRRRRRPHDPPRPIDAPAPRKVLVPTEEQR
ncbi:branched-chain amino acid ABC transporter permease [uncultured Cellulomonas sp.]|uniref:branched-chain amino acid ABC transporter permease n=1 Tax=uncultured Cellulomonas sp. TaxID=189682 RepID=UPI0028F11230|nr:branched-chain amino acid ABC transporter permease [uncultured Cellulomonas sp.]